MRRERGLRGRRDMGTYERIEEKRKKTNRKIVEEKEDGIKEI